MIRHQATDSVTKAVYTWSAPAFDNGAGYPGPNSPENILVTAGLGPGTVALPAITATHVWRQSDDGSAPTGSLVAKNITDTPFGADPTQATDSTAAIQSAIDTNAVFDMGPPNSTYQLNGTIQLRYPNSSRGGSAFMGGGKIALHGKGVAFNAAFGGAYGDAAWKWSRCAFGNAIVQHSTESIPVVVPNMAVPGVDDGVYSVDLHHFGIIGSGLAGGTGLSFGSCPNVTYLTSRDLFVGNSEVGVDLGNVTFSPFFNPVTLGCPTGWTDFDSRNKGSGTIASGVISLGTHANAALFPLYSSDPNLCGVQASSGTGLVAGDALMSGGSVGFAFARDATAGTVHVATSLANAAAGIAGTPSGWTGTLYFFAQNKFGAKVVDGVSIIGGQDTGDYTAWQVGDGNRISVQERTIANAHYAVNIAPQKALNPSLRGPFNFRGISNDEFVPSDTLTAWGGVPWALTVDTTNAPICGSYTEAKVEWGCCRLKNGAVTNYGALGFQLGPCKAATFLVTIPIGWIGTDIRAANLLGPIVDYGDTTTITGKVNYLDCYLDGDLGQTHSGSPGNLLTWANSKCGDPSVTYTVNGTIPMSASSAYGTGGELVMTFGSSLHATVRTTNAVLCSNINGVDKQFFGAIQFTITNAPNGYAAIVSTVGSRKIALYLYPSGVYSGRTSLTLQRLGATNPSVTLDGLMTGSKYTIGFGAGYTPGGYMRGFLTSESGSVLVAADMSGAPSFSESGLEVGFCDDAGSGTSFGIQIRRFCWDSSHQSNVGIYVNHLVCWAAQLCELFKRLD
jgi:hypothetical protein